MGPLSISEGDTILFAKGSGFPIVLRYMEREALAKGHLQTQSAGYCFVDKCYVDGIMDGELVKNGAEWSKIDIHLNLANSAREHGASVFALCFGVSTSFTIKLLTDREHSATHARHTVFLVNQGRRIFHES